MLRSRPSLPSRAPVFIRALCVLVGTSTVIIILIRLSLEYNLLVLAAKERNTATILLADHLPIWCTDGQT
jgi:hypothetical protein